MGASVVLGVRSAEKDAATLARIMRGRQHRSVAPNEKKIENNKKNKNVYGPWLSGPCLSSLRAPPPKAPTACTPRVPDRAPLLQNAPC